MIRIADDSDDIPAGVVLGPKKEMCCLDLQFAHICAEDLINNKRSTSSQTHSRGAHTQGDVQSKIASNTRNSGTIDDAWV